IIFSDVALRQMARNYPQSEQEFARISGVGEKKLHEFGSIFLSEISAHLATNPRQIFADDSFTNPSPTVSRSRLNDTSRETLKRFRDGCDVPEIAQERGLTVGTIYSHLATAMENGESISLSRFLTAAEQQEIAVAFGKFGWANLAGVRESLGEKFDY